MEIHLVSHRHCHRLHCHSCNMFILFYFLSTCDLVLLSCAKISAKRKGQRIQWQVLRSSQPRHDTKFIFFFLFSFLFPSFVSSFIFFLYLSFFFFFFLQIDDSSLPERDAAIHVESRANSSHHPSNHHYHKYSLSLLYFFSRSFTRTFSLSLSHFIIFTRSLDSFVLLVVFSPYADNTLTGHTSSVNSDLPHSAHHHWYSVMHTVFIFFFFFFFLFLNNSYN